MIVSKSPEEKLECFGTLNESFVGSIHFEDGPAIIMPVNDDSSSFSSLEVKVFRTDGNWPT